ncbi:MAG: stage II sporulation protein E [Clostridiaceae bacterium]|nr:stage II sporulation protein E [Clostridiaceae bacterium]
MKPEISLQKRPASLVSLKTSFKTYLIILPVAFMLGRVLPAKGMVPFGLPFYIASHTLDISKIAVAFFVLIGTLTGGGKSKILTTVSSMILYSILNAVLINKIFAKKANTRDNSSKSMLNNVLNAKSYLTYAVPGLFSCLIIEIIAAAWQGMLLYDVLMAILNSLIVFIMVFIFCNFALLFDNSKDTHILSNEEMMSVIITFALSFIGLGEIKPAGFNVRNMTSVLAILIFGYRYGVNAGTAVGAITGIISDVHSATGFFLVGCYAFCGLLAGIFRNLGKTGSIIGFFIAYILAKLYLNDPAMEGLIHLKEVLLAILVFTVLPLKIIINIAEIPGFKTDIHVDRSIFSIRTKDMVVEKLNRFSRVFMEVAKTFREIASAKTGINKQDILSMFDRVADRVCKGCSLCLHCWDRNFYSTYQVLFRIVEKLDKKGYIDNDDIPAYFLERCERVNDFVQAVNNMYEILKVEMMWRNKLGENRAVISSQMEELSKVIAGLSAEIDTHIGFKTELENTLAFVLKREGIKVEEVSAFENKYGKYEIGISHKGCKGRRYCTNIISKVVSQVVEKKMVKDSYGCCRKETANLCVLKLVEEEKYCITTGIACVNKYDEKYGCISPVSGDSYASLSSSDGKHILALSDGMGSGEKAAMQSKATIKLIEQFIESGIDRSSTVKLINSILALKTNEDDFSTIDLCIIDLNGGDIEFIKIGTAPTIIRRKDRVDIIKTISLPAGILSNVEIELISRQLDDGDMVIMVTDGVVDAFTGENGGKEEKEKILQKFVGEIKSINPQAVADIILDEAYKNSGSKPADDMTVIAAKFWKKAI